MPTLKVFSEMVLNEFSKDITDRVFLMIQNDADLMHAYLDMVRNGDVKTIDKLNQSIGEAVKNYFNLENDGKVTGKKVKSSIIRYYTKHKIKPLKK